MLEANGATVDRETTVAKIPAAVVERAMSTAPHEYTLGARNPEYDLPLDGEHVYISSDGCGVFCRDPTTGEVRSLAQAGPRRLRQGRAGARQRAAPRAPSSAPRTARRRRACCTSSTPACATARSTASSSRIKEDWEARSLIKMAEAMAGGKEELKQPARCSRPSSAP